MSDIIFNNANNPSQINTASEDLADSLQVSHQGQLAVNSQNITNSLPTARIFVRIPNNAFESHDSVQHHLQSRDMQNQGEIKAEPIKFELSEGQHNENNSTVAASHKETSNDTDPNLITARPKKSLKCNKCPHCWFASIFEERLNEHRQSAHIEIQQQEQSKYENPIKKKILQCPACPNEFVVKRALEIHLELDHEMPLSEIQSLLDDRSVDCSQSCSIEKPRTNRIFIKSVDVLRQPQISSQSSEGEGQHANFFPSIESVDANNTIFMDLIDADSPAHMVVAPSDSTQDSCSSDIFNPKTNAFAPPPPPVNSSNPRRKAKIYIKNVDILKEPIFVPPIPAFQSNILNVNDNLNLELFPLSHEPAGSLDIYDFNTNTVHSTCSSGENDITVLPNSDPTPKKPPNALHLRTVDELNLMNMNEVQNLLAPLPDQSNNINHQISIVPSAENSKSSDDVLLLNTGTPYSIPDFPYNQDSSFNLSETEFMPGNWSSYYNFDDIEANSNATKNQVDNPLNSTHYDLNTPQQVEAEENDEDILFVCAQELINDSETLVLSAKQSEEFQLSTLEKEAGSFNSDGLRLGEIVEIEDDMEQQGSNDVRVYNEVEIIAAAKDVEKRDALIPEKGRIYVADNLMEDRSDKSANEVYSSRRSRGRLFGSRQIGITKLKKTYKNSKPEDFGYHKCDQDCAYRFRDVAKLDYHKRCHTGSQQRMQCPECNQDDFNSWNTLHTHLWRQHQIDMELYSCEFCSFKTPMLSRLMNTHIKIHSDERNFKCTECEKAFKNSKQLKDHRRVHRQANQPRSEAFVCPECSSSFGHMKSLKEHIRKKHSGNESETIEGSKSQKLTSEAIASKLQCDKCSHTTNDHNAMRRHKMTHDSSKRYQCQFCDYSCIQSTLYQKHIQLKHPDQASEIILKCSHCSFATINRRYYEVHLAKHRNAVAAESNALNCDNVEVTFENRDVDHEEHTTVVLTSIFDSNVEDEIYQPVEICHIDTNTHFENESVMEITQLDRSNIHYEVDTRHKIKVKSDSVLTDPSKFCTLEPVTLPHLEIL